MSSIVSDTTVTVHIRVSGVVQGVGYRPFVYRLAHELGVLGWVRNDPEGVLVEAQAERGVLERFAADLAERAPELAVVHDVVTTLAAPAPAGHTAFSIVESEQAGARQAIIPPDSYVCADCLGEMVDPADRRYRYPFITCTNCGPRYSIVTDLPYDRPHTTMAPFTMCADCDREYHDPGDRRYHAQPNGCWDCGPRFELFGAAGPLAAGDEALTRSAAALAAGRILAVKSVGGFHLAADATDAVAVATLRARKRRDSKPFAVMVPDLAAAARIAYVNDTEERQLTSPARPIVLARKRPGTVLEEVAPRNPNIGIMLPSAPHHHLLLADSGADTLIMTSGNVSGFPIAFRNDDALDQLFEVADAVLVHDRDIVVRVDDSVLRVSSHPELDDDVVTFFRRARGYAPYPVDVGQEQRPIVAYGAELKSTVALSSGSAVYLSQHIGDLKNDATFASHRRVAQHLARLYEITPRHGAYDMHPQFRSTVAAASGDAPMEDTGQVLVQHHHAHMAACMAENRVEGTTVGVVFDGVGYGTDGSSWGGEFLVGDHAMVRRVAHLRRLPLLGGDQAVREPIRTGLAVALDALGSTEAAVAAFPALAELDPERRRVFEVMARRGVNSPPSSSMGRLFDGVAAMLGVCALAEYEAQGPIELEGLLERDLTPEPREGYGFTAEGDADPRSIDFRPVVRAIARDMGDGVPVPTIARRFHTAVVELVVAVSRDLCARGGTRQVALSGGVFLNEFLLINSIVALRREGVDVFWHRDVPVNDGGIALGQVLVANAQLGIEESAL